MGWFTWAQGCGWLSWGDDWVISKRWPGRLLLQACWPFLRTSALKKEEFLFLYLKGEVKKSSNERIFLKLLWKLDLHSLSGFVGVFYPEVLIVYFLLFWLLLLAKSGMCLRGLCQCCYCHFHDCYFTSSNVLCDLANDCGAILHHYGK